VQVCTLLQADNHASTPPLSFFKGRMPFLPPNQQRQSSEGKFVCLCLNIKIIYVHVALSAGFHNAVLGKGPGHAANSPRTPFSSCSV